MTTEIQQPTILTLQLTVDQINAILAALGKLPTESGVWPLVGVIAEQANSQLPQAEEAVLQE